MGARRKHSSGWKTTFSILEPRKQKPFLPPTRAKTRHSPLTLLMHVAFVYSSYWISKMLVNGFNGSTALASLMFAKYEQIRSQKFFKKRRLEREKGNNEKKRKKDWKKKKTFFPMLCSGNYASFPPLIRLEPLPLAWQSLVLSSVLTISYAYFS